MKKTSVIICVVLLFIVPLIGLIPGEWNWNPRLEATLGTTIAMVCAVILLNHLIGYMAGKAIAFQTGTRIRIAEFLISLPLFVPVLLLSFGLYLTWIRLGLADRFSVYCSCCFCRHCHIQSDCTRTDFRRSVSGCSNRWFCSKEIDSNVGFI